MSGEPAAFDTIVAPATPLGRSALAIVRIDGPRSGEILEILSGVVAEPRTAKLVRITRDAKEIDECVVIKYSAPHSFTGNDIVELILHGNPLLVESTIRAAVSLGARIAQPGEFTERALLNGKLDLVQAESIADLIAARTEVQARLSLGNVEGVLSRSAAAIRESLLHVISRLEAALDFADEGYQFISHEEAAGRITAAIDDCSRLADTFTRGRAATRGLSAVILGAPNAGKSTLLNRLVGSERAIVTPLPGTTRDIVRETVEIGGLPVEISDTAGLRTSTDLVEGIGVERARQAASRADLVLYLIDASAGQTGADILELQSLARADRPLLVIYTKTDLAAAPPGELAVSVTAESGVAELLRVLDEQVRSRFVPPEESATIVNERQLAAVTEAREALILAREALGSGVDEQMVLVDIHRGANSLAALTGAITRDDILDEIFSKFCIGK